MGGKSRNEEVVICPDGNLHTFGFRNKCYS